MGSERVEQLGNTLWWVLKVGVHADKVLAACFVEALENGGRKATFVSTDDDADVVALLAERFDLFDGAILRVIVNEDQLGGIGALVAEGSEQPGGQWLDVELLVVGRDNNRVRDGHLDGVVCFACVMCR